MFGRRAGEFAVCDCEAAAAAVGTATDDGDDGGGGVKMIINSGRRATIHTPRRRFMVEMHEAFDFMGLLQLRFECDSSSIRLQHATRCVRFECDSSTLQHRTRSYVLSSNNEHVNSFAML